jgi:hypothetical protein
MEALRSCGFMMTGGARFHVRYGARDFLGLALLNATQQFFLFAFRKLELIIRPMRQFLLEFAFGNIPVAFDREGIHNFRLPWCEYIHSTQLCLANGVPEMRHAAPKQKYGVLLEKIPVTPFATFAHFAMCESKRCCIAICNVKLPPNSAKWQIYSDNS